MSLNDINESHKKRFTELESKISEQNFQLDELKIGLEEESKERQFYQLIADFTFGWELWIAPNGMIKYCSPSCTDLTGFSANQIINSHGIGDLLVYSSDQQKFQRFLSKSLEQSLINQSLEFRILTRTKQLRWCLMNVRGVYNKLGKYLGLRASIQDITQLKRAMGHIRELEAGKEFENKSMQRLQNKMDLKDRELVSILLQLSQKNELLTMVLNNLKSINTNSIKKAEKEINKLVGIIQSRNHDMVDWQLIENQIQKLHPDFFKRLFLKHPKISLKEKKLSAYILLGLSSKEISGLFNITYKSVEIARVRLRKKLGLSREINLANYLHQI